MNAQSKLEVPTGLDLLRQQFPPHQISKLPKPTKAQTDAVKADFKKGIRCQICGAWHHPDVVHLDYVGHAALTDRLLDCDPNWTWEPMGTTPEGLPAMNGGLWIKLTVCGVSRYGYGAADGKQGGDAIKEMIGDALRNAAMRFGAALDLWHKGDLHVDGDNGPPAPEDERPVEDRGRRLDGPYTTLPKLEAAIKAFVGTLSRMGDLAEFSAWMETPEVVDLERQAIRDLPSWWETAEGMPAEFIPVAIRIDQKKRDLEQIEDIHNTRTIIDAG